MLLGVRTPDDMQAVQVMGFLVSELEEPVKDDSRDDDRNDECCHGFTSLSVKIGGEGWVTRCPHTLREKTRRSSLSTWHLERQIPCLSPQFLATHCKHLTCRYPDVRGWFGANEN